MYAPTTTIPPVAWKVTASVAGALFLLLVLLAGRYGYHRDELYFLAAGRHPAFGYVDQPPLTPLLARGVSALAGDTLVGLRVLPALLAATTALVAALTARELGGGRAEQLLTAAAVAISAVVLATGHSLSTTNVDLLVWAVLGWLLIRAVRVGGGPAWLLVGATAGIGLQNKTLVVFLLAAVAVSLVVAGPRRVWWDPWLWAGGGVALLLWLPNLVWQATHGWPQLALAGAISAGSSGSSQPWWLFVPFQLVLVSPALVPVWGAGLWVLLRWPELRAYRFVAVAYALLVAAFLALRICGGGERDTPVRPGWVG